MKPFRSEPSAPTGGGGVADVLSPPLHRERLYSPSGKPQLPFGANVTPLGVAYRVWCPSQKGLVIVVEDASGAVRELATTCDELGYHHTEDPEGRAGDCYRLRLSDGSLVADPVSRAQRDSVTGCSVVVNPHNYTWRDKGWQRPAFRELVIYELHIGAFTQEGTFLAVIGKLAALKEMGINAIELMPIADFPGDRNWGYDGVLFYAPARAYGRPDDLRALVDAAHALGIAVILDVVYNHLGPDGSGLNALAPEYFHPSKKTPWGPAFNFDGPNCQPVRDFFSWNPVYWMTEFHIDGVRLDATHAINDDSPRHILTTISDRVHALGGYIIAEDERNEVRLVEPSSEGGFGLDAVWADDFHHTVRVGQTREQHAYLQNFSGTLEETIDTIQCGWRFRGHLPDQNGSLRGSECSHVPPSRLIHCISNHDQVGNQAFGHRLSSGISPHSYRAISMLLCLTPYTPMIFMGQEWAATTSFLFFTDHNEGLGKLITEGRRQEFSAFPDFADQEKREKIPDPQAEETFLKSKLNWDEAAEPLHAGLRALYSACLKLRHAEKAFRPEDRDSWEAGEVQAGVGYIRFENGDHPYMLLFHLWPNGELVELDLNALPFKEKPNAVELVLSSNATKFGGSGISLIPRADTYVFGEAETLLLRA